MTLTVDKVYSEIVEEIFGRLFREAKIADPEFHSALLKAIAHSFHLPGSKVDKEALAKQILDSLFSNFSHLINPSLEFNLSDFLDRHALNKADTKRFLIAVLYGLYYGDIDLTAHQTQDARQNIQFLMFQIIAETISPTKLRKILKSLPLNQQVALICYAFRNYREGSYYLLMEFDMLKGPIYKQLQHLIQYLRNNYFDADKLYSLLLAQSIEDAKTLNNLLEALEHHALEQTKDLYKHFNALIPLMVDFPVRVLEELKKYKPVGAPIEPKDPAREQAEQIKEGMYKWLSSFFTNPHSFADFHEFIKIFGLRGHYPLFELFGKPCLEPSLIEKISVLHEVYENPLTLLRISQDEHFLYLSLVHNILLHLDAMKLNPEIYKEGLDNLTLAMPTKGKALEGEASLPSILKAQSSLIKYINRKSKNKISLKDYPFFVFDQSSKPIFTKNARFIHKLNHAHKSSIVQVSKEEALSLAKKINVDQLINTTGKGDFGYGGARNCVFLLSPVLREAFRKGKKSVAEVLEMSSKELILLFDQHVFGKNSPIPGNTIFMVDDDIELPVSNLFSHALFAQRYNDQYFVTIGLFYGRWTKGGLRVRDLNKILTAPLNIFTSTQWSNFILSAMMAEYLSKPKICINVPLGSEENQLKLTKRQNILLKPNIHLAGTRHPTKQIPTHFFVGLEEHLAGFMPYAFHVTLACDLVDASNFFKHCILPWQKEGIAENFINLQHAFSIIADEGGKKEMQTKFWKNLHDVFFERQNPEDPSLGYVVAGLINMDIDAVLKDFQSREQLDRNEKKSLANIGKLYAFFQQDAKLFQDFALSIIRTVKERINPSENWYEACTNPSINLSDIIEQSKNNAEKKHGVNFEAFPLTQGFYFLAHAIGLGTFCDIVGKLSSSEDK